MDFTISFRNAVGPQILDAFCRHNGYEDKIRDGEEMIDNPQSKNDFALSILRNFIKRPYLDEVANESVKQSRESEDNRIK
jgi:hypothetical protein